MQAINIKTFEVSEFLLRMVNSGSVVSLPLPFDRELTVSDLIAFECDDMLCGADCVPYQYAIVTAISISDPQKKLPMLFDGFFVSFSLVNSLSDLVID